MLHCYDVIPRNPDFLMLHEGVLGHGNFIFVKMEILIPADRGTDRRLEVGRPP